MGRRVFFRTKLLGASDTQALTPNVVLTRDGELSVHVQIDNGSGANPSDSPVGTWQLWTSGDGVNYERQTSTAVDAELAKIAPNGNAKVNAAANFVGVPGSVAQLRYAYGSGGAATRAQIRIIRAD